MQRRAAGKTHITGATLPTPGAASPSKPPPSAAACCPAAAAPTTPVAAAHAARSLQTAQLRGGYGPAAAAEADTAHFNKAHRLRPCELCDTCCLLARPELLIHAIIIALQVIRYHRVADADVLLQAGV